MKNEQSVILKKLLRYIRKYLWILLGSVIFAAVSSILMLYLPILILVIYIHKGK